MKTVRDIDSLRQIIRSWRQDGEAISLVPTMGSLHQGHVSLMRLARENAERVITSIYVNPTQFGPTEDFDNYPRPLETDRRRLARAGVDVMFVPDSAQMYPFGEQQMTQVSVPGLSTILCGNQRPGHFDGVTSVVSRLFNIVQPDVAVFGQKDHQQLVIIRRMASDLHVPVRILAGETQREKEGLALSSRNRYLSDEQRGSAAALYRALVVCRDLLRCGAHHFEQLEQDGMNALDAAGFEPEYFSIRTAADLGPPDINGAQLVVLAAARLGTARLIDNLLVAPDELAAGRNA